MASADKLALLRATKADLKAALIEQGQTPGDVFSEYPDMVRVIQTGGGVDTCTITITGYAVASDPSNPTNSKTGYVVTRYVDGTMILESANHLTEASVTITDVVCGSFVFASGEATMSCTVGGGVQNLTLGNMPTQLNYSVVGIHSCVFQAPSEAGATGTITFTED